MTNGASNFIKLPDSSTWIARIATNSAQSEAGAALPPCIVRLVVKAFKPGSHLLYNSLGFSLSEVTSAQNALPKIIQWIPDS